MSEPQDDNLGPKTSIRVRQAREDLQVSKKVGEFVSASHILSTHILSYGPHHRRVKQDANAVLDRFRDVMGATLDAEIEIDITNDGFEFHTIPLIGLEVRVKELKAQCLAREVARIQIRRSVTDGDLIAFLTALFKEAKGLDPFESLQEQLNAVPVENIAVLRKVAEADAEAHAAAAQEGPRIQNPRFLYISLIEMLKEVYGQLSLGVEFLTRDFLSLSHDLALTVHLKAKYILPFAMVRRLDRPEYVHPVNTAILALAAAVRVVENIRDLDYLAQSALLLDTGLTANPALTRGVGPAIPADASAHPILGAMVLDRMSTLSKFPMILAYEHHLRDDFSGFPTPLARWQLNFFTSVTAIAEQIGALTTGPKAICPNQAMGQLAARIGSSVGVDAFHTLFDLVGLYPPGSLVELDSGAIAVILRNRDPLKIRVLTDEDRILLDNPETSTAMVPGGEPGSHGIRRAIDANSVPLKVIDYLD